MEGVLESLGTQNNRRYSQEELAIRGGLNGDSTAFEDAHMRLGRLLGFDAGNQETPGAPDPWWIVDGDLCFIFEDHSDADAESSLGVTKARQVASHRAWVRANIRLNDNAIVVPILISPIARADRDALPHLDDVLHWPLADFRAWADRALEVVRTLRSRFPGSGDMVWRLQAADALRAANLTPIALLADLQAHPASELPTA